MVSNPGNKLGSIFGELLFWGKMKKVLIAFACALLTGSFNLYAEDERGIEEILVTAQRTTESIQDVPIAVSAFNSESLAEKQIDAFSDLRFHVPNVTYNKTNFTGNNFQIRAIGAGPHSRQQR